MPSYSERSEKYLNTCHPDIQKVFKKVIEFFDITITCGLRDEDGQKQAIKDKASYAEYPKSKHNRSKKDNGEWDYKVSDAIDTVPYPVKWPDMSSQTTLEYVKRMGRFYYMAGAVLTIAFMYGVKLRWGGTFKKFFDGPHFERVPDEQ